MAAIICTRLAVFRYDDLAPAWGAAEELSVTASTYFWLPTDAFAEATGISVQAARGILRRSAAGQPWRGVHLMVRQQLGGRGWEVAQASLPWDLQNAACSAASAPLRTVPGESSDRLQARWAAVGPALAHPPRSPERRTAVSALAAQLGISERSLYRWIERYAEHGLRGLARRTPRNAGHARIIVSREFDRACLAAGHDEAVVKAIAEVIHKALKGLWASRAEKAGVNEIRRLAEFMLWETCEARGLALPHSAMRLSRRTVERFAQYRVVNQRRNDRKAFDDAKPRIRRDWTMLAPMERIVADVKHLDVIVERDDGTPAWPKIVAFMDTGTGRVFVHPVLLARGEGVRQEHVIEAFLAMVCDPAWGFPQGFYLDNGAEFGALAKIDHALQQINDPGARTLIFAQPYNASAKPIESLFARLDRYVFSMLPGYAGPDRMKKQTQKLGKPPKPYPGSWPSFCALLQDLIRAHNQRPVGGQWQDRSPEDWFAAKVEQGWKAAQVEPAVLDAAFCDRDSRRVDRGVLRITGVRYSHPLIHALPARTVVDLALPWRKGAAPLFRALSGAWVPLRPEVPYPARWIEGARESSRRQRGQARHVADLAKDAPTIDPIVVKLRAAGLADRAHTPKVEIALDLGVESDLIAMAHERRRRPAEASGPTEAETRRQREMAQTERLERRLNRGA